MSSLPHPLTMPLPRDHFEIRPREVAACENRSFDHRSFEPVPPRTAEQRQASALTKIIEQRTNGRVQNLRVEVIHNVVHIRGTCATFYAKQLAQHAAMDLVRGLTIANEIRVAS